MNDIITTKNKPITFDLFLEKWKDRSVTLESFMDEWYDTPVILNDEQASYIWLHFNKVKTFGILTRCELKCQEIINDLVGEIDKRGAEASADLAVTIEERLSEYDKQYAYMEASSSEKSGGGVALRFRNWVKGILIEPAAEFGKRCNPKTNEDYQKAKDTYLSIREELEKLDALNKSKEEEKRLFVAHVNNSNIKRVAKLKEAILKEIITVKEGYLKGKVESPDINALKEVLKSGSFQLDESEKYERKYLTNDEALEIVNELEHPDEDALKEEFMKMVDDAFANYNEDLNLKKVNPNANVTEDLQVKIDDLRSVAKIESDVNDFVATSKVHTDIKPEYTPIKRKLYIECQNSDEWEVKILSRVIKSYDVLKPFMTELTDICNRKLSQYANAIGKIATEKRIMFDEFEYKEDKR